MQDDDVVVEIVVEPELVGCERSIGDGNDGVLERVAGTQCGHGDVLLAVVGVHGREAGDTGGEILDGVGSGGDHAGHRPFSRERS